MTAHPDIHFDFNFMMADHLGPEVGLTPEHIENLSPALAEIQKGLRDLNKLGQLPFLDLPYQEAEARRLQQAASEIRTTMTDVLVLGIGGSALGLACLEQALLPLYYQLHAPKKGSPRLWIVDNVDPAEWSEIRQHLSWKTTFIIVISKSGTTTETLAAYLYFLQEMKQAIGDQYRKHVAVITDPHLGPLRQLATDEKLLSFNIHPGIGGRYSVLTSVGLFPSACVGIDIEALLAGARRMIQRCSQNDSWMNPALLSATLHFLYHREKGRTLRVLMAYSEQLTRYEDWFLQLWAESLGKRYNLKGEEVLNGSTPLKAVGTTDQHSLLQLLLEGPQDKVINLIGIEKNESDMVLPTLYAHASELTFPPQLTAGQLITIEREATALALKEKGRPNMTVILPEISAYTLGQLLLWSELETVVCGELFNVNPFDQPGVESIKNYVRGALGKKGYEKYAQELKRTEKKKKYIL